MGSIDVDTRERPGGCYTDGKLTLDQREPKMRFACLASLSRDLSVLLSDSQARGVPAPDEFTIEYVVRQGWLLTEWQRYAPWSWKFLLIDGPQAGAW